MKELIRDVVNNPMELIVIPLLVGLFVWMVL